MDALNPEIFLTNLGRAVLLGLAAGIILWLFRRRPVVQRVRLSVIFSVVGWSAYWLLSGTGRVDLESLTRTILAISLLLTINIGVQFFDLVVWEFGFKRSGRKNVPRLLLEIFNVGLMLAATLVVLNRVFEVDLSALLVTSTVVSAVIGLALQDMLGNVVSGLALQFDRPFDLDDWIKVGGEEGRVTEMKWRTVTLRSIDNQSIIIPNTQMAGEEIINYSRPTREQRLHVKVGLPYGAAPGDIKQILMPAVQGADGVSLEPPPDVLVTEYGDSAIQYDVRYWITDYSRTPEIRDDVLSRIWYALRRAGVSVPFPIRDVNLRTITEEQAEAERVDRQRAIVRALRPLVIFSPLADDQMEELAVRSQLHRYYAGELLVRQGEMGESMFVIVSGQVRVTFERRSGEVRELAVRGPGEFFGEMSLLTGERRSASVHAKTDLQVVEVEKGALAAVLSEDLSRLEALTEVVERYLADFRALEVGDASSDEKQGGATGLFNRIARFLGLG